MSDETAASQIEYLLALFGLLRRDGDRQPVMNAGREQDELYERNMTQLANFCNSSELTDLDILQFFGSVNSVVGGE